MDNTTTFDITKIDKDRLAQPSTYNQLKAISYKFSKAKSGKMNWQRQKRISGCLYNLVKENKLSFNQAHLMLSKNKKLPKVYEDLIAAYLEANPETELTN